MGRLAGLRSRSDGAVVRIVDLWPGTIYPSHIVTAYLDHLVACRALPEFAGTLLCGKMTKYPEEALLWNAPASGEGLEEFVRGFLAGGESPLPFDPAISLKHAKKMDPSKKPRGGASNRDEGARSAAMKAWEEALRPPRDRGDTLRDPRIYSGFWSRRLFAGRPLPLEDDFGGLALRLLAPLVREMEFRKNLREGR
jgi:exonuclease V gamma subunit